MALHLRDRIVDAVKTLLTGLVATGPRVYVDRDTSAEPFADEELPGLNIEQGNETTEVVSLPAPRLMQAVLGVDITAHVRLATGTLTRRQLNLIAQQVQVAMAGDRSLGGLCKYTTLTQTDIDRSSEGEKPAGTLRLTWQILYLYAETTPDVAQ